MNGRARERGASGVGNRRGGVCATQRTHMDPCAAGFRELPNPHLEISNVALTPLLEKHRTRNMHPCRGVGGYAVASPWMSGGAARGRTGATFVHRDVVHRLRGGFRV